MNGKSLTLTIGLLALAGCVPPPPPSPIVVETAPPPVAAIPVAAPVVVVSETPVVAHHHRAASAAHPAVHHVVHRPYAVHVVHYISVPIGCGTTANPCNVEHKTLPVQ